MERQFQRIREDLDAALKLEESFHLLRERGPAPVPEPVLAQFWML